MPRLNTLFSPDKLSLDLLFKNLTGNYVILLPDNPNFSICYASDSYLRTANITQEELQAKGILKICEEKSIPSNPMQTLLFSLNETIATKQQHQIETVKIDSPDREKRYCRLLNTPILDDDNNIMYILHSVADITQEKKIEEEKLAQKTLEERLRISIEVADLATWDFNPLTGELIWNNKYREIFGLPNNAFVDNGVFLSGLHPDDIERVETLVAHALSAHSQEKYEIEYRVIGINDKKLRWVRAKGKAFFNEKGQPYRFIGTALDITEHKQMMDALQESEILFKSITTAVPSVLFMTDTQGDVFFINETWLKWTGKSLESQLKRGWINCLIEEDRDKIIAKIEDDLVVSPFQNLEYRVKFWDGKIRWCMSSISPYYNKDGKLKGYVGSMIDIHERKEEELRKNDFIAMASHELKTPLTSIKGYVQLMENQKRADPLFSTILSKATKQIDKMTQLIRDFLNLSKMEAGKFNLVITRFNLSELINEMVEDIQPLVKNQFIIEKAENESYVEADREKISQVITNFLSNAAKYCPNNDPVYVSTQFEDNYVKFAVTDNGIGIKEDDKDKIFQRFYRGQIDNQNTFSGFGIGLYLCSEIINRHNGQIGFVSKEGKGSTFYFQLPLSKTIN